MAPCDERERVSVGCQTEPNLISMLIDWTRGSKKVEEIDWYQEYVRSAQCAQFWPLDKNPIRSLVPSMLKVDLPEQYLKNESLMFDLVQAISNSSKLVNLLAKYMHHIVPNVIISKRIDLIPLITCTIRNCRDESEQERLVTLLFNLIKRPNEEQRRMILSGIVVVLQVNPSQSSTLLLPNLWDHVADKFPERRILLAESCATLAHYVRPVMRTKLILSILIQLLKDKNATVRSAACKSFACLLTLIMDRDDEVFDACLSTTEDILQDVMQQTPVSFCEFRYELEQMRFCALESTYPLLCMWAVKLGRFKVDVAEFYLSKAQSYFSLLTNGTEATDSRSSSPGTISNQSQTAAAAAAAVARRRSTFLESRQSSDTVSFSSIGSSSSSGIFSLRRQSAFSSTCSSPCSTTTQLNDSGISNGRQLTSQRACAAYLKMLHHLVPFVFSDAVHGCAWLSKSNLNLPVVNEQDENNNSDGPDGGACGENSGHSSDDSRDRKDFPRQDQSSSDEHSFEPCDNDSSVQMLFERPLKFPNRLLDPTLIIDQSAIVAFHEQLKQDHMIGDSLDWIFTSFLPKFLALHANFAHPNFYPAIGAASSGPAAGLAPEFIAGSISSTRHLCILFGRHLTRTRIRPMIKDQIVARAGNVPLFAVYLASLTCFEPIEQQEFEEIVLSLRQNLLLGQMSRSEADILALSIKLMATSTDHISSPSTRQKFLTYILDALVSYSNQNLRPSAAEQNGGQSGAKGKLVAAMSHLKRDSLKSIPTINLGQQLNSQKGAQGAGPGLSSRGSSKTSHQQQTHTKESILIIFRHILTCLIDQSLRPPDWAHILVTKFLPLLISLANDSSDVHICTYARLMCAQLVETFDTYLAEPKLTKTTADAMSPALSQLKALTEQIKASNLNRQIECLIKDLNERFFKPDNEQSVK